MNPIKESISSFKSTKTLVVLGLLTAIYVVLSYFTFYLAQTLRITFTFIPLAVAGAMFGPVAAGIMGALGDFLGYLTSQFGAGAYNFGFTINAFIMGFVYGLFLYKGNFKTGRVIISNLILVIIIELILTPIWLSMLYGDSFVALVYARITKAVVLLPVQVVIIKFVVKKIYDYIKIRGC